MRASTLVFVGLIFSCTSTNEKVVEINPSAIALNDKAVEEIISLNPQKAIVFLDSALSIEPNYATAFTNKIAAYNQLMDFNSALETTLEYSRTPEFPVKNNAMIAMAYERIGEFDKSITYYKKALKHFLGNDWKNEPLIGQVDFAIFTTFVDGRAAGLEKFEQVISSTPPGPGDLEFITRIKNEINHYQGGGYIEILDNTNIRLFCTTKEEQESFELTLKEAGLNFEDWSSNNLVGQCQYKIKPKFAAKALQIGLIECEN